jgi:prolyl-tRNA synthetase
MRLSTLLGKTLRQSPADAHLTSHQLLVRAGYVRALEPGLFAYLPLGNRTLSRLQSLIRVELVGLGGQEVEVPPVPDTESAVALTRLVRGEVDSYRQLPLLLFQTESRILPQAGTRTGLFGATERRFTGIYAYGDLELAVQGQVTAAIDAIFTACELQPVWAQAAGEGSRAYFSHSSGDEDLVRCSSCDYAAERSRAATAWPEPPGEPELPTEEVSTPGCNTIAALAEFLAISPAQTLKMVFYSVEGKVTCIVIRGDRSVDEAKLARVLGTDWYYASLEEELAAVGAVGGCASPIGLDSRRLRVVADASVRSGRNFVSGANRPDYHVKNVNVPRDFAPGEWADLALIEAGDPCPHCGASLMVAPAFALAESLPARPCQPEAEYLDVEGRGQPLWSASWSLDLGRVMATIVQDHHDDYGIVWPVACAPFDVHLVSLDARKEGVEAQADALYDRLWGAGFSALYDDRNASAGVKFNDADLIGIPLRLTVSKRSAQDGLIEAKWRASTERLKLDDDGLDAELARLRPS